MTPRTVRLKLDYNLDPSDSEVTIEAVKSNALNIEFGIFQDSIPYDLSGLTSVTMVVRPARGTSTNLAAITLPVASLTALPNSVRWNRGTMQHGIFEWTTAQMNQTVTGDYDDYWWSCYALLTTNEEVTLGNGIFRIYESNIANGGVPPVNPGATITADEADARYVRFDTATSLTGGQQTQARENIDADNAANLTSGIIPDARMPNLTGDITTVEGAVATTLATVNGNVGSFGSATQASAITVNAKGLVTAASAITVTPAESSITFTDITTNNATSLKHGFLPKLSGSASDVLKGDGTWGAGGGGGATTFAALTDVPANSAGVLTNDGAGLLSYTATTYGGNGVADNGKIVVSNFGAITGGGTSGGFGFAGVTGLSETSSGVLGDSYGDGGAGISGVARTTGSLAGKFQHYHASGPTTETLEVSNLTNGSKLTVLGNGTITAGVWNGTDIALAYLAQGSALSVLGVTGNATADHASIAAGTDNQVLRRSGTSLAFGAVNLASSDAITGTLPVANGGTGITSLGTGVATWLGTPTIANLNSAVSDADVAILGANTFTAAQMIDGSADAVQLTIQGNDPQTSNLVLLEKSDGTDVLTIDVSGNITGNGADYSGMTISAGGTHRSLTLSAPGGSGTILMNPGSDVQSFSPVRVRNISGVGVPLNGVFRFASTNNDDDGSVGVAIKAKEAATLQLGVDAEGVTNQTLTAASRITSDGVGANLTISAGNGRGGAGGSLIFSTYTTAGAATIGTLTTRLTLDTAGLLTFADAVDMAFNTTTGTKIGTATGQKIGFWNATPVVQQVLATGGGATVDNVITFLQTVGLCKQS